MTSLERVNLLFVVGSTACGKSDLAVEISEACARRGRTEPPPEIVNCDSIQFFDGVEIGATKPEPELLARAKHHLVGHVPLGGEYTAGDFRRDAIGVFEARASEGVFDFLTVGGSGFYVLALEKGMFDVPEIAVGVREALESEMELKGPGPLHAELEARDPAAAVKIKPADRYRILRALEILRSSPSGETLSSIRARFEASRPPSPFRTSKLGLFRPRDVLRKRVIERARKMIAHGLIEEVERLRAQGLRDWAPLSSVGYKEAQAYLDGVLDRASLEDAIVTSTMQLAKRQMTWFKKDTSITWFDSEAGWSAPLEFASRCLET